MSNMKCETSKSPSTSATTSGGSTTTTTTTTTTMPSSTSSSSSLYDECVSTDADLFSFMSNMHLHNVMGPVMSRKRKLGLDVMASGASKTTPPTDTLELLNNALHTPLCSGTGFADDEDRRLELHQLLSDHLLRHSPKVNNTLHGFSQDIDDHLAANLDDTLTGLGNVDPIVNANNYANNHSNGGNSGHNINSSSRFFNKRECSSGISPPLRNSQTLDFTTSVMSEALLALPNLSISNGTPMPHPLVIRSVENSKEEKPSNNSSKLSISQENKNRGTAVHVVQNFGALDLSNDDAHLPDEDEGQGAVLVNSGSYDIEEQKSVSPLHRKTFIGSLGSSKKGNDVVASDDCVSKEPYEDKFRNKKKSSSVATTTSSPVTTSTSTTNTSATLKDEIGSTATRKRSETSLVDSKPLLQSESCPYYEHVSEEERRDHFQYVLAAPTSIATKLCDPSITYLNQGQSYELRMKKLGDLSAYRERVLKSVMRICFQDRRLQYMEAEQLKEWQASHPGERILEIDVPLSYGLIEHVQSSHPNVLTFKWDPTRETGVFIRVNCISTEFTPKKHGGEKGVPFRLQIETFDPESQARLHAGGCILQVFKLKGAERKHKQDRDKIGKRPVSEQEKYAPGYESTVFTDLPVDAIYVPHTRSSSESINSTKRRGELRCKSQSELDSLDVDVSKKDKGQQKNNDQNDEEVIAEVVADKRGDIPPLPSASCPITICASSGVETVQRWLKGRRYGHLSDIFERYDGRDLLRLTRDDVVALCNNNLADGLRLYNDLHLTPVGARTTLYVTASSKNDEHEFYALFLEDLTLNAFVKEFSAVFGVDNVIFSKVFLVGPGSILVRVTDAVIRYTVPESIFMFSLRQQESVNGTSLPSFEIVLQKFHATSDLSEEGGVNTTSSVERDLPTGNEQDVAKKDATHHTDTTKH